MVATQLTLPIAPPPQPTLNLTGIVREIMLVRGWLTPYQIQHEVEARTGEWHSDASISARMRELRRPQYGCYTVERRPREGSRAYEYRLIA